MEMITIIFVAPGKVPEVKTIPHSNQAFQQLVGGHYCHIYPWKDKAALLCHDDGKLIGLPPNRILFADEEKAMQKPQGKLAGEPIIEWIAGNFIICGLAPENFCSLTPEQIERYTKRFWYPEQFYNRNGYCTVLRSEPGNNPI